MASAVVHLRPFREPDLELLTREATDPAYSAPFEWFGFKSPQAFRRRWEEDGFLTNDPHYLVVALPDDVAIGSVMWRATYAPEHGTWEIGVLLAPDHRGQGAGTAAQRLLVEHLFATTTAGRIWAGTEAVACATIPPAKTTTSRSTDPCWSPDPRARPAVKYVSCGALAFLRRQVLATFPPLEVHFLVRSCPQEASCEQ